MPPPPPAPVGYAAVPDLSQPKVVVEAFLDVNCPFSRKMFKALTAAAPDGVIAAYKGKPVQFVFQNVIQPWHPAGCMMHEASLAVRAVKPEAFLPFMDAVYDKQEAFSDEATWDKSRAQINEMLLALAEGVGVPRDALAVRLALSKGGNSGTATTRAVKYATKYHRARGIHVTPTVLVNGLEAGEVSSGWTGAQWKEFLDACLAAPLA